MGFEAPGGFRIPVLRGVQCGPRSSSSFRSPADLETFHQLLVVLAVKCRNTATIPTYRHEPKLHVNHQTVLRIKDGLPKMKDLPKEMGGLGETLPSSPLRGGMTVH